MDFFFKITFSSGYIYFICLLFLIFCTSKYITDNAKIKDIIKNPSQKGRTQM